MIKWPLNHILWCVVTLPGHKPMWEGNVWLSGFYDTSAVCALVTYIIMPHENVAYRELDIVGRIHTFLLKIQQLKSLAGLKDVPIYTQDEIFRFFSEWESPELTYEAKVLLWLRINILLQTAILSALLPHRVWGRSLSAPGNSSTSSKITSPGVWISLWIF